MSRGSTGFYTHRCLTTLLGLGVLDKAVRIESLTVYDLRTNMPSFGKTNPLTESHFDEFVKCYGKDPLGGSRRRDLGENGRFRSFTRKQISERGDSLDITWLKDGSQNNGDDVTEPQDLVRQAIGELEGAMDDLRGILAELGASK